MVLPPPICQGTLRCSPLTARVPEHSLFLWGLKFDPQKRSTKMTSQAEQGCIADLRSVGSNLQKLIASDNPELVKIKHKLVQALLMVTTAESRLARIERNKVVSKPTK